VGSKGKARTWVHGLSLNPAAEMTQTALMQRPENTTPFPFAASVKRLASEMDGPLASEQDEEGQIVPDQVFLSRLPPNIQEARIAKALQHVGTIVRVHLAREEEVEGRPCRGFGWVTFSTPEEAQAACELNELLEAGKGRKIGISMSRPKRGNAKRREIEIVIEPHADCWFCLVNPRAEKHMVVTTTTQVYVASAKGPINPSHVLVLPVKHAPCFAACPPDLQNALQAHIQAIRKMCRTAGQDILVWERWTPFGSSSANHMMIQVLPIGSQHASRARNVMEDVIEQQMPGISLQRLTAYSDVVELLNDDSTTPYIYFEVPVDSPDGGERGVERFAYAGVSGISRIPVQIGREVACQLLGCKDRLDWRQWQEDRDSEGQLAAAFRERFKPFQPSERQRHN